MTMPIAAAATQIAWGLALAPSGFSSGNASTLATDTLQWAGNYLSLCGSGDNYTVQVCPLDGFEKQRAQHTCSSGNAGDAHAAVGWELPLPVRQRGQLHRAGMAMPSCALTAL